MRALRAPAPTSVIAIPMLGSLCGLAGGLVHTWPLVSGGFPLLATLRAGRWLAEGFLAGVLLELLATLFEIFLGVHLRRTPTLKATLKAPWQRWLATGLALTPILLYLGYRLNRELGIRPSELTRPVALRANLTLLATAAVIWVLVTWWRNRPRAPRVLGPSRLGLVGLALVAVLASQAPKLAFRAGGAEKSRVDVIVLLVDALRADHLGSYGYGRPTSPAIDALAADSVLFEQAVSASTFTKSSIASLFTGRYPYRHGVYWGSHRADPADPDSVTADLLSAEETTLAEAFRRHGYLTAAWVQNSHLRGFMGFAQGFVEYHDQQGDIARIHRRFFPWLRSAGRRYPFFAYLHYIDLHDPYRPKPPYDTMFTEGDHADPYQGIDLAEWGAFLESVRAGGRRLTSRQLDQLRGSYDGQLRAIDDQIATLIATLKAEGRYESSLIVLTADHGDGFGEHGFIAHSTVPYDELLRVPLLIKLPANRAAGMRIREQVSLVDVVPTVLDLAGVAAPPELDGCSLVPVIRTGSRPPEMDHCGTAIAEIVEEGAYPIVAVRTDRYKYIHHQHRADELYDLQADPGEQHNLLTQDSEAQLSGEPREMRALALHVVAQRDARKAKTMELDQETIRELKSLGYLD